MNHGRNSEASTGRASAPGRKVGRRLGVILGVVIAIAVASALANSLWPATVAPVRYPLRWTPLAGSTHRNEPDRGVPSGRISPATWLGRGKTLWLFGGYGLSGNDKPRYLDDLWSYNLRRKRWRLWAKGPPSQGRGKRPAAYPLGRVASMTWKGVHGTFWMFGGFGETRGGIANGLQDLWRFDAANHRWTRVGGSLVGNVPGRYGTHARSGPRTWPGARSGGATWTGHRGHLWLFGGYGDGAGHRAGWLNDLWRYNPARNRWTWVSGSRHIDRPGRYGTKGRGGRRTTPGGRNGSVSWVGPHGNLWLFGGYGYGANPSRHGPLNDLWEFQVRDRKWIWQGGSRRVSAPLEPSGPHEGPGGLGEGFFWPGRRAVVVFSGFGDDVHDKPGYLDSLWAYHPRRKAWVWLGGGARRTAGCCVNSGQRPGAAVPGAAGGGASWQTSRHLFLFGGYGLDAAGNVGYLNRLWEAPRPRLR